MADRLTADEMVRGMGAAAKLVQILEGSIRKEGGDPAILALMTRERFQPNVKTITLGIIGCDWRISASEMRDRAEKNYRQEYEVDPERIDEVRNLWWTSPLIDLGLPFRRFGDDDSPPIPSLYFRQLSENRKMSYPLFLSDSHLVDNRVVVDLNTDQNCDVWKPGEIIDPSRITSIAIADSSLFDFEK